MKKDYEKINLVPIQELLNLHKTQFEKYLKLLLKWNRTYNLTAITSINEIWERHFLDSITPLPLLPATGAMLDMGTGAGFPGIPLKIVRPTLSIKLIEASRKKCNFCDATIRELGLKDIKTINGRIEDKKNQGILGKFDVIISRATFSLKEMIQNAIPYLDKGSSQIIAMKGEAFEEEIREAKTVLDKNNLKIDVISEVVFPLSGRLHRIIVIKQ